MAQFDYISTKSQLGRPDELSLFVKKIPEDITISDTPMIIEKRIVTADLIYGIPGVSVDTYGGGKVYSSGYTNSPDIIKVVNKDNIFYEQFLNDYLYDPVNSTGTWDTTNRIITLNSGEYIQSKPFYMDSSDILNALPTISGDIVNALIYLSSDGTNFKQFTNKVQSGFNDIGQIGKWKILASGGSVTANLIIIRYNQ